MASLYQTLIAELAAIERQQQDLTLSPLDQQLLDQAWEDVTDQLNEIDTISEVDWRDAREVIDELDDWEYSAPETPPPPSPIRFAPSPPPITFGPGDPFYPPPVARSMSFAGIPPLSATHEEGYPPPVEPFLEPPPPPAPFYPSDEEIAEWNNIVDDREGCMYCPGCHYCTGYGYDGNDEV